MPLTSFLILIQYSLLGIVISVLFVALLLRQRRAEAATVVGIALGLFLFSMHLRILCRVLWSHYAQPDPLWFTRIATPFLTVMACFLPTLILWSWRTSPILRWKTKVSGWLLASSCAGGLIVMSAAPRFGPDPLRNATYEGMLVLIKVAFLGPAFISVIRLPLDGRLRSFMKICGLSYLLSVILTLLRDAPWWPAQLRGIMLALTMQTLLVCGLLGSFIVAARFRYSDVFARWSTRLAILGTLSLAGTLAFASVQNRLEAVDRPAGDVLCCVLFLLLLLFGGAVAERCVAWLELHLLQRFDLGAEVLRIHRELSNIETQEGLFAFIESELQRRLEVGGVQVLSRDDLPLTLTSSRAWLLDPVELNPNEVAIGRLESVDVLIQVPTHGVPNKLIGVSTGPGRQSLNSGEIRFLKRVGQDLGARLQLLETESLRRAQALREASLQQQLTEAELRALRAQVNPHFLFNSLNTIADLIERDPAGAEQMTLRLSRVFRHVLAQSERQFVSLGEEFAFLRNYLDIEQMRFGENLHVHMLLNEEFSNVRIPTLLLQPLVENALRHGLARRGGRRYLEITVVHLAERILIQVNDDGAGFEVAAGETVSGTIKTGVGLANIRARLQTVYGDQGRLQIDSAPMQGCRVGVSIPLEKVG
jgi:two-component system, LytTR family, sensor kinase